MTLERLVLLVFVALVITGVFFPPVLIIAVIYIVLLPPHLDPAIRFKEWTQRKKKP